jgi:hypothetical protein
MKSLDSQIGLQTLAIALLRTSLAPTVRSTTATVLDQVVDGRRWSSAKRKFCSTSRIVSAALLESGG